MAKVAGVLLNKERMREVKKKTNSFKRHPPSSFVLFLASDASQTTSTTALCLYFRGPRSAFVRRELITFHDTLTFNLITPDTADIDSFAADVTERPKGGKNESETTPSHLFEAPDE